MRNLIPNEQKLLNYFGISGNLVEPKTFVLFCSICLIANVLRSHNCGYLQLYIVFIIIYYRRIVPNCATS